MGSTILSLLECTFSTPKCNKSCIPDSVTDVPTTHSCGSIQIPCYLAVSCEEITGFFQVLKLCRKHWMPRLQNSQELKVALHHGHTLDSLILPKQLINIIMKPEKARNSKFIVSAIPCTGFVVISQHGKFRQTLERYSSSELPPAIAGVPLELDKSTQKLRAVISLVAKHYKG